MVVWDMGEKKETNVDCVHSEGKALYSDGKVFRVRFKYE